MERKIFIQKIKRSDLQQINYLIINFKRNDPESLNFLMNILESFDFYEILLNSDLEEIVYFYIHMFIIGELKYFNDKKIRNFITLRLEDKKYNIGDRLVLLGLFELSFHSLDIENIQIFIDIEELSKWFEDHTDPLNFHYTRVVLALTGLKIVDHLKYSKFCYSSLKLNSIINELKKAVPSSEKIEQIINRSIMDLQELVKDPS